MEKSATSQPAAAAKPQKKLSVAIRKLDKLETTSARYLIAFG